jgi:hypothetical protein
MDYSDIGGYIAEQNDAILPAPERLDIFTHQEPTDRYDANPFDDTEHSFSKNSSGM